jgi:hypothetical protein
MKSKKLFDIRKEAKNALYRDNRDRLIAPKWKLNIIYCWVPLLLALVFIVLNQKLTEGSITYFITGISIFAGLFFNLLIVVSDKMEKRMKQLESDYQPKSKYAEDYKILSERLIASISYAIILSFLIIGLMFFSQIDLKRLNDIGLLSCDTARIIDDFSDYLFSFLSYFVGLKFLMLLLHILIDIYEMLIHEMNMKKHQKEE